MHTINITWRNCFRNKRFRLAGIVTILAYIPVLSLLTWVLYYAENRNGIVLNDPVLEWLSPTEIGWLIFSLTYGTVLAGILAFITNPVHLLRIAQAYLFISLFRSITLLCVPLSPPEGIIPLRDMLLEGSFYAGRVNLNDLFFSGHTAAVFLFFLASRIHRFRWMKWIFLIAVFLVGFLLMKQHVHYTIDVLAAPAFTLLAWYVAGKTNCFDSEISPEYPV